MRAHGKAAFAFIFVTVALDMLALGVMIPVLPKLLVQFEGGDVARAARVTGIFGFVWALMQFLFSPIIGALSDRYGRRPVILLSNLGLGLDYVLMAMAPSVAWLFVGRIVSGITAASMPTATAYVADVTPEAKRAQAFGMLGAAFGLGFVIGPALGGVLGQIDLRLPFWVAAALSLLNALYGFFILPESLAPERRETGRFQISNPFKALVFLRAYPKMFGLAIASFLLFIAHESLPSMFVLYADYRYHWDSRMVGITLAGVGIGSTIVSATVIGPVVKRFGERTAALAGFAFGVAGFALYGAANTGALFAAGIPLMALWGMGGPTLQAILSQKVGPSDQGKLQGALSSLRGVSGMIGPLVFTNVFSVAIARSTPLPGAPYYLSAVLLAGGLWLAARQTKTLKTPSATV